MIERLVAHVLDHPRIALALWAVVVAAAALGLLGTRVDFSSTAFFGDDAAQVETLRRFAARWGPDDRTLVVVVRAEGGDLLAPDTVREIDRLSTALEADEAVASVVSFTDAMPALDAVTPLLVSEDRQYAAILVELAASTDDLATAVSSVAAVRGVVEASALSTELAGIPATRAAFFGLTVRDQLLLGPLALAIVAAGLLVVFRRLRVVIAAGVGAGVPLLLLVGTMGWIGEPIGLLNQAYFTLLPVIAVADTIHLVVRTDEVAAARPSASGRDVVLEAASKVGWACLLTSLTTAVGFASLAVTSMPILRNFGLFAALGILFAFATVVLLVPLLLRGLAHRRPRPERLAALARFAVGRSTLVIVATVVIATAAAWPASRVTVDNHLSHLLQPDHPVRKAGEIVDGQLGGSLSLELDLAAPDPTRLAEVRTWAEAQPEVRDVLGPWRAPGFARDGHARVSIRVPDMGGKAFGEFEARARAALGGDDLTVTGTTALAYNGVNRITGDLRLSLLLVFAVVTVVIAALLRRPGLAAIGIPPNLLPLWLGYAAFGLWGLELDPIGAVILAVALGIAVDDTIHVTARFVELREAGHPKKEAAALAVERTGRAVAITSIVLAAGLAVNTLSSFPPLTVLGTLGAGVILLALVADLLLLPALLGRG